MTDYEYLIHLLYCTIHGTQPAEKPEGVSFKNVLEIGKMHEVANIAFLSVDRLTEKPSSEVYRDWQMIYFFSVQRDARQQALYADVTGLLHANGIRTLEAQGTVTKTLYPSPEWRMMSDVDLIIDADNMQKAIALLAEIGIFVMHDYGQEVELGTADGLALELHTDFFKTELYNRAERYADALNNAFFYAVPDEEEPLKYHLEPTYFYLYSILHIIKHYETAGCGIRRVLDIYYLKRAFDGKINHSLADSVIDGFDFRRSYKELFALEAQWFEGMDAQYDLIPVICDVIGSGNHGNELIFTRNNIRKDRSEGAHLPVLRAVKEFVFPGREYIYLNYPECRERNYPLWRCRLYRIGKKIKSARLGPAIKRVAAILKTRKHTRK